LSASRIHTQTRISGKPSYSSDPTQVAVKQLGMELKRFGILQYAEVLEKATDVLDTGLINNDSEHSPYSYVLV
jgi:hypothetical protein